MIAMTHAPQLFEALTETGMRPEAARRVERELQSSIEVGIARHHTDGHALLMTKADGIALENTLRGEMVEMKSELRQEMAQLENRLMRHINDHGWKMMGFQVAVMGAMTGVMLTAFRWMLAR